MTMNHDVSATKPRSPLKILIVTSDRPSHPYACAKLANVLGKAGHEVTLVAPKGLAYDRIKSEMCHNNNSVNIKLAGTVAAKKSIQNWTGADPMSWQTLYKSLLNPFPRAEIFNDIADNQEGMYGPIKQMVSSNIYDVVIPVHTATNTVCDAVEAAANEHDGSQRNIPACIIFSSLPFDPTLYLGERRAWRMPRPLTALPHVATYPNIAIDVGGFFRYLVKLCWMALDAFLLSRAWRLSAERNNQRRAKRGLPPMKDGFRGHVQRYPVITFGGTAPFTSMIDADNEITIPPNVTPIGALDTPKEDLKDISGSLKQWIEGTGKHDGIVYACFGTQVTLTKQEITAVTGDLTLSLSSGYYPNAQEAPRVLLALSTPEQHRLRGIIDDSIGEEPTVIGDTYMEYLNGALRIEADVPQVALLHSGKVKVFVSHIGFGGYCEGVQAGVPFVATPFGFDQYYNAMQAVQHGIAYQASPGLLDIECLVWRALDNDSLTKQARTISKQLKDFKSEEKVVAAVENIVAVERDAKLFDKLSDRFIETLETTSSDTMTRRRSSTANAA